MANQIRKVDHYSAAIRNKAGEGAKTMAALRDAGVNFIAVWAYPKSGGRQAILEMIPDNGPALSKAAKKAGLTLSKRQTAFSIAGQDHPGAVAETLAKLGAAGINVVAIQAACSGEGRFGGVVFVEPADVRKAAKALGAS
jgi:hypothetical protein